MYAINKYILIILFISLIFLNLISLLKIPPVWPDEALIADMSLNILNQGRFGTDLLSGTLPGVETIGWGYPPLFFIVSAAWFKIIGFSILKYRLLSLLLGFIFIIFFIKVSAQFTKIKTLYSGLLMLPLLMLNTDIAFIKAVHIARPEIQVLLFGFLSLFFYLKKGKYYYLLSGFCVSLAFLSHYLGVIFVLSLMIYIAIEIKEFYKKRDFWLFFLSFSIPIIIWVITIFPNISYFINDVTLRLRYKVHAPYWIHMVFSNGSTLQKITYIFYIFAFFENLYLVLKSKKRQGILVLLLLIFSWIFYFFWQTEYSFIFVTILSYFSISYLLLNTKKNDLRFKIYIIVFSFILLVNFSNLVEIFKSLRGNSSNYNQYTSEIVENIPDNTTIYLSTIPDPYFGFKNNRNNTLYEFPGLPTEKENVVNILNKSDYIIFSAPFESIVVGNIVIPYIQKNSESSIRIGRDGEYSTFIFKLKPRSNRS